MTMKIRVTNEDLLLTAKIETQSPGRRGGETAFRTTASENLAPGHSVDLYVHFGQKLLISEDANG